MCDYPKKIQVRAGKKYSIFGLPDPKIGRGTLVQARVKLRGGEERGEGVHKGYSFGGRKQKCGGSRNTHNPHLGN